MKKVHIVIVVLTALLLASESVAGIWVFLEDKRPGMNRGDSLKWEIDLHYSTDGGTTQEEIMSISVYVDTLFSNGMNLICIFNRQKKESIQLGEQVQRIETKKGEEHIRLVVPSYVLDFLYTEIAYQNSFSPERGIDKREFILAGIMAMVIDRKDFLVRLGISNLWEQEWYINGENVDHCRINSFLAVWFKGIKFGIYYQPIKSSYRILASLGYELKLGDIDLGTFLGIDLKFSTKIGFKFSFLKDTGWKPSPYIPTVEKSFMVGFSIGK